MTDVRDVIIIGGGPAGYTAALYAARDKLSPLVIEGFNWGGQLMITSEVENYPGYEDGVMGPQMMAEFRVQANRFGTEFLTDDVTRVDLSEQPFKVYVGDDEHLAKTVIVATGATARQLGLESEHALQGRGVSYCATCDGSFFRERKVVVVGGGDSAMEEASFLARFATKVKLVHRRDESGPRRSWSTARRRTRRSSSSPRPSSRRSSATTRQGQRRPDPQRRNRRNEGARDRRVFVAIGHDPKTGLFVDSSTTTRTAT